MAENSSNESSGRKHQWFARRQVYLRTGQESQYVELSPLLQMGVALGFGALALWLIGASYGAVSNYLSGDRQAALQVKLSETERLLGETQRERDEALEDASRLADLGAELAEANASLADAPSSDEPDEAPALRAELEQTKKQLEDLHLRLSESKSDQAALQARFEAEVLATSDQSEKTAEEAASLHAQLEEAFGEVEALGQERDEVKAKLAALSEENVANEETTERNTALLKAATAEIERLQGVVTLAETQASERTGGYEATIGKLEEQLDDAVTARDSLESEVADLKAEQETAIGKLEKQLGETVAARDSLESEVADLRAEQETAIGKLEKQLDETVTARDGLEGQVIDLKAELDQVLTANAEASTTDAILDADAKAAADAAMHVESITAGLREADLLATIDDLKSELAANAVSTKDTNNGSLVNDEEIAALRQRVVLAESEVERLILSGLKGSDQPVAAPAPVEATGEAESIERLRSELLAANADIIKLKADVKAANQRLAEKAETNNGATSRPDNSAKLEQQLASTRSRVQQLNKALADAKLREVAIDLALINVVPSPSPPAPR